MQPVLEGLPKWQLLRDVLTEVQAERQAALLRATAEPQPGAQAQSYAGAAPGSSGAAATDNDASSGAADADAHAAAAAAAGSSAALLAAAEAPVLVVVREPHLTRQLAAVIREGSAAVMQRLYEHYLMSKLQRPG